MARLPRVAAVAVVLLLAGCGSEPTGGPPEMQYGVDECSFCRMIVSEPKFAAALVDEGGSAVRFDDIGCMVDDLREGSVTPKSAWVHDYAAGTWIAAEAAWFVRDPRGTTPMGSGLIAFASRADAEAYAAGQATAIVAWQELVTKLAVE